MRGALAVGIDNYSNAPLSFCVRDATEIAAMLSKHYDGHRNFHVEQMHNVYSKADLWELFVKFFNSHLHTGILYFAGHAKANERGGCIITPDSQPFDEGISMDDLLKIANASPITDKIILLDCCRAGNMGTPAFGGNAAHIGEGIVILAASRASESALEINGHGVFTSLLLAGLDGGAADIMGRVTATRLYGLLDESLGFMEQRPQFKANVSRSVTIRNAAPLIEEAVLRKITDYFMAPDQLIQLSKAYSRQCEEAVPELVIVLNHLQQMNRVGLVVPDAAEHMYYAAIQSQRCKLTALGKRYWNLVKKDYL